MPLSRIRLRTDWRRVVWVLAAGLALAAATAWALPAPAAAAPAILLAAAIVAIGLLMRGAARVEAILLGAIENVSEGFVLLDRDFRVIALNPGGLVLEGRPPEGLLGRRCWEAWPGLAETELGERIRQGMADGAPLTLEHRVSWPGDSVRWLETRIYPLRHEGLALFHRDVTDRHEAAERLSEERERYAAAFENTAIGMAEVGLDGRWLRVNGRLAALLGYTREALLGMTFVDVTHPDDLTADLARYAELLAGRIDSYVLEKRYIRQDGSVLPINLTVGLVRAPDGTPLHAISSIEDITERRAAEAAIRDAATRLEAQVAARTADLEAANRRLEAFAYTVSHDLRAPLRGMEGFARILLDDFGATLGPVGQRHAARVVAAAERMEGLIADLLALARLQQVEVRRRVIDPLPILCRLAEEMLTSAGEGAAIAIEGTSPLVLADGVILAQVLTNLLGNAVKFRRPGEPARVQVRAEADAARVRLLVEDRGIGVALEHQGRIFDAFERLHGPEAYPGTGIGLAIVRTGMERLGGSAGVRSAPGEGACFWIELERAVGDGETGDGG